MAGKKFAFESDEVSIAFTLGAGLGDCIMAKKVFEAIVELAPRCAVDLFYREERHRIYAEAFYGGNKNVNDILIRDELYQKIFQKYDLALWVVGSHYIQFEVVNTQRLQIMAPALLDSVIKIHHYNQQNIHGVGAPYIIALRDMTQARILHKSCYEFLSCDGALPIRDDKVKIPLSPEYKKKFAALKLDNYITIYTDIDKSRDDKPKNKVWPIHCLREYVARMKKRYPQIEIVQVGGADDVEVENADRRLLTYDLELTKYILANSLLHVGCEGGLVHLATQLGTKCIVLFGCNSHDYTGYAQNINLVSEVCSPCMYILPDWSACLRGFKEPICMLNHTPQMVCEVTCNYLRGCL